MGEANVGISVFDLDMQSGAFTQLQTVTGLRNPTYLALHPNLPILYAGERETTTWGPIEALAGNITTLAIGSDGELSIVNRLPIGAGATYVSIHPTGRYLFAAMPGPHSVAVFPIGEDGRVEPASTLIQHQGRGVNSITLERPFPHSIRPDASGTRVLACDMGLDRLMVYDLDQTTGRLAPTEHPFAQLSSEPVRDICGSIRATAGCTWSMKWMRPCLHSAMTCSPRPCASSARRRPVLRALPVTPPGPRSWCIRRVAFCTAQSAAITALPHSASTQIQAARC